MSKMPAFQFYSGDWMKDPALRACSPAARGLWIDCLCLMHDSPRRGYLEHANGRPVTPAQLARMTGCTLAEVARHVAELESVAVFSREAGTGAIFSRRMARDEEIRKKQQTNGLCGGRPKRDRDGASGGDAADAEGDPTRTETEGTAVPEPHPKPKPNPERTQPLTQTEPKPNPTPNPERTQKGGLLLPLHLRLHLHLRLRISLRRGRRRGGRTQPRSGRSPGRKRKPNASPTRSSTPSPRPPAWIRARPAA